MTDTHTDAQAAALDEAIEAVAVKAGDQIAWLAPGARPTAAVINAWLAEKLRAAAPIIRRQAEAERDECTCQSWPPEGPDAACAIHGAIRALNVAVAERDELLRVLNRFRDEVDFSEATTHMDVAEIVLHVIRGLRADLAVGHPQFEPLAEENENLRAVDRVVEAAKAWRVRIEGHVAVPLDPVAVALIAAVDALAEVDDANAH